MLQAYPSTVFFLQPTLTFFCYFRLFFFWDMMQKKITNDFTISNEGFPQAFRIFSIVLEEFLRDYKNKPNNSKIKKSAMSFRRQNLFFFRFILSCIVGIVTFHKSNWNGFFKLLNRTAHFFSNPYGQKGLKEIMRHFKQVNEIRCVGWHNDLWKNLFMCNWSGEEHELRVNLRSSLSSI